MMILMQFSKQEITKRVLLRNLVKVFSSRRKLEDLRGTYRKKVLEDLQNEMRNVQDKLFPKIHFLKRFLLYDGLPRYHQDIKLHANLFESGQQSNSGISQETYDLMQ